MIVCFAQGDVLPMMFGVRVSDEDAEKINRTYNSLRVEGHGPLTTLDDILG